MRIGGIATHYYIPENIEDLIGLSTSLKGTKLYIISGGSNLLISDEHPFENVISMKEACPELTLNADKTITCGASVRIQTLINFAKEHELGGIEYLYSLPALFGGIIRMNAGRGRESGCSISDYVVEVYCIEDGKQITLSKEECQFAYRSSVFESGNKIITGAKIRLIPKTQQEIDDGIKERLALCKRIQDHSGTTFGTVFKTYNNRIMGFLQKHRSGKSGISWSAKRGNWLINDGNGSFKQAFGLIKRCKTVHRIFQKQAEEEVIIWE